MTQWAPIRYLGFWDVPLVFLVSHDGNHFLFDRQFDDELDDYPDDYTVYLMPELPDDQLPADWTTLRERAVRRLGEIPIAQVQFDPTRRRQIETGVLNAWTVQPARASG